MKERGTQSKVVFSRMRVCSVRYEISHITYRTSGYRYESHIERVKSAGCGIMQVVQIPLPEAGYSRKGIPVPGVRANIFYRSNRTVGYRYERLTELAGLSHTGM